MKKLNGIIVFVFLLLLIMTPLMAESDNFEDIKKRIYCFDKDLGDNFSFDVECPELIDNIEGNVEMINAVTYQVDSGNGNDSWKISYKKDDGLNVNEPELYLEIVNEDMPENARNQINGYNMQLENQTKATTQAIVMILKEYFVEDVMTDSLSQYSMDGDIVTRTRMNRHNQVSSIITMKYKKQNDLYIMDEYMYFEENPRFNVDQKVKIHYITGDDKKVKPEKFVATTTLTAPNNQQQNSVMTYKITNLKID